MTRSRLLFAAFAFGALVASTPAHAQSGYPGRPIHLYVPFPPGGGTDLMAREVAQGIGAALGQPVLVENRPGAASITATAMVAKMPADGHALLFTSSHYAILPGLYKSLPYDPRKDLVPVSLVARVPMILVVNPSLPARDVKELIALAKSAPKPLTFASSGTGGVAHLSGELFKSLAGIELLHVPYKGAGPAMNDLRGGHVQMMFDAIPTSLPHIRAGALRPLAWTGSQRSPVLPDLPTIAESGVPGYASEGWVGMFAPAGTSSEIVQRIGREVRAVLDQPAVRERQLGLGFEVVASAPGEFATQLEAEFAKWERVVRESGTKAE